LKSGDLPFALSAITVMPRFLVFFVICAAVIGGATRAADSPRRPPNIVFILTDDQRAGYLGIAGHRVIKTPNIDRIGREGVWFKNAFAVTPLCSPSRASFLTGLYAHQHRVINNDKLGIDVAGFNLLTWPRQLREAGYETAFIGKWHMGFDDSRRPGFDRWLGFKGQGMYIQGVVNNDSHQEQLDGYMTDYLNEQAVAFVEQKRDKPFALVVHHKAVHYPYLPAKRHESLYADYEFQPPPSNEADLAGKPVLRAKADRTPSIELEGIAPEPQESRRGRGRQPTSVARDQFRCLASVDDGVGQLFAALEKTGQLDSTILIYASDNGYLMGEHGQIDTKRWAYEPSIRVPLVMRYPPLIPAGSVREQIVANIDIAPTMLELAGVKPLEPMHGQSLVEILRGATAPGRPALFLEYFVEKVAAKVPAWQCVRSERWKYIHYLDRPESFDELYDLKADPNEWHNLATEPAAAKHLSEMQSQLAELLLRSR
jgi:N-acetylglucosamine-6-sulfatase